MRTCVRKLISFFSDLSLPVVFGGAVCFRFFADLHGTGISFPELWIVCSGIFSIYLFDHLKDLKAYVLPQSSEEAFFYLHRFRKFWIMLAVLALLVSVYLLFIKLNSAYRLPGGVVSGLVLLYFLMRKFGRAGIFRKIKELFIAAVATLALGGITAWVSQEPQWVFLLSFFLICFQDMLLFSWIDYDKDLLTNSHTLATDSGIPFVVWVFDILALVNLAVLGDTWFTEGYSTPVLVFFLMQTVLVAIRLLCEFKKPKRIYRFWTDMIFVLPLVVG